MPLWTMEADCPHAQALACLAKVVAQSQELAGVRASLMAASLLVADRQAHGDLPAWPSCLARLTGYAPAHLQDLAAAHLPALRCMPKDAAVFCFQPYFSWWQPQDTMSMPHPRAASWST